MSKNHMFFTQVTFECQPCKRKTDIYFESEFNSSEIREVSECNKCGTCEYCDIGDVGYRSDLSNPDYPPWQLQVIKIPPEKILCDNCLLTNKYQISAIDLVAWCEVCDIESMKVVGVTKVQNKELHDLLDSLR